MKALHTIVVLSVVSSFFLNSTEKYPGLSMYLPKYHALATRLEDVTVISDIYYYCNPTRIDSVKAYLKGEKRNPHNCEIISEYLLQQADASGNTQDNTISNKDVRDALQNMGVYNQWEMNNLEEAVKRAKKGDFLNLNK